MVRRAAAILLALHGVMHWPGFAVPWKQLELAGIPYTTTVLGGGVDIGATGIRVFGLLWLATIISYLVAGFAIWRRTRWSIPLTAGTTVLSLVLSVVNQPLAWEGVVIDAAILGVLALLATRPSICQRYS